MSEKLPKEQLSILQHALGLDAFGKANGYARNHFICGTGEDFEICEILVSLGLMKIHAPRSDSEAQIFGGPDQVYFFVTSEGRDVVSRESPRPPKKTRAQERYEKFLRASDAFGVTFKEFLNARMYE